MKYSVLTVICLAALSAGQDAEEKQTDAEITAQLTHFHLRPRQSSLAKCYVRSVRRSSLTRKEAAVVCWTGHLITLFHSRILFSSTL